MNLVASFLLVNSSFFGSHSSFSPGYCTADRAEHEPLGIGTGDAEVRAGGRAAFAGADPVALVAAANATEGRRQLYSAHRSPGNRPTPSPRPFVPR